MTRLTESATLGLGMLLAAGVGCELIASPDRSLIPGAGGGGTTSGAAGMGGSPVECTTETVEDDCGTDTDCRTFACTGSECVTTNVAQSTTCDEDGGTLCDGEGSCVTASCSDGVDNGDETDVDCGGSCTGCPNSRACALPTDCLSGHCADDSCRPCNYGPNFDLNCAAFDAEGFCDQGVCAIRGDQGDACEAAGQCVSGSCSDGKCCDVACADSCDVCSVAEGASAEGVCTIAASGYAGKPACTGPACDGTRPDCP